MIILLKINNTQIEFEYIGTSIQFLSDNIKDFNNIYIRLIDNKNLIEYEKL